MCLHFIFIFSIVLLLFYPFTNWERFLSRKSVHSDRKIITLLVLFISSFAIILLIIYGLSGPVGEEWAMQKVCEKKPVAQAHLQRQ